MSDGYRFMRGDFIEVTAKRPEEDFGTIRGAALDTREFLGDAQFSMVLPNPNGQTLWFNLNDVEVKRLFIADVARGG